MVVDSLAVDERTEAVVDYGHNPEEAGRMEVADLAEEDHSSPEEGRNCQEVASCTALGEDHNCPAADRNCPEADHSSLGEDVDHSFLGEGLREDRRSFHSHSQDPGPDPEGSLLLHLDVARRRSGLGRDNQTCCRDVWVCGLLRMARVRSTMVNVAASRKREETRWKYTRCLTTYLGRYVGKVERLKTT